MVVSGNSHQFLLMNQSDLAVLAPPRAAKHPESAEPKPAAVDRETRSLKPHREKRIKAAYHRLRDFCQAGNEILKAGVARGLRFCALPVALICLVEWKECNRNVLLVFWDHLYIFFVLGYFPDNYSSCRLWEVDRKDWIYYFGSGYDPASLRRRKRHVLRGECEVLFEDKEVCYHLCRNFQLPLPTQYCAIGPEDDFAAVMSNLFDEHGAQRLVVKQVGEAGGKGTCLVEKDGETLIVRQISDPLQKLPLKGFSLPTRAVVQEWVRQHPVVCGVSSQALNTVRMVTLFSPDKEVIVVGAYIRIGVGSSFLDSGSGVGVKVDITSGRLDDRASDGRGRNIDFKPAGYDKLSDVTLPNWDEAIELAHRVQEHFAPFNRFLGMDIGFSESGPVLVEINDVFDCGRFEGVTGTDSEEPSGTGLLPEVRASHSPAVGLIASRPMSQQSSRHRRNRSIRLAIVTSLMSKGSTVVLQFVSLPIGCTPAGTRGVWHLRDHFPGGVHGGDAGTRHWAGSGPWHFGSFCERRSNS